MDHIGIDVPKRESPIYILAEGGEVIHVHVRPNNKKRESIWRKYRRWVG